MNPYAQSITAPAKTALANFVQSAAGNKALVPVVLALLFGTFLLAGTGFAQPDAVHNAAHDVRHAIGFPCH
jgi:cobalt transporter subunit CbtB